MDLVVPSVRLKLLLSSAPSQRRRHRGSKFVEKRRMDVQAIADSVSQQSRVRLRRTHQLAYLQALQDWCVDHMQLARRTLTRGERVQQITVNKSRGGVSISSK